MNEYCPCLQENYSSLVRKKTYVLWSKILLTSSVPCWWPSGRTQSKIWLSLLLIYASLLGSTTFGLTYCLRSLLKYLIEFLFWFCFHVSSFFQNLSKYSHRFNFTHHDAIWTIEVELMVVEYKINKVDDFHNLSFFFLLVVIAADGVLKVRLFFFNFKKLWISEVGVYDGIFY